MLCFFITGYSQIKYDDAVQGTDLLQHNYTGQWVHNSTTPSFYLNTQSYSNVTNAYFYFAFTGTRIEWFTETKSTHGIVGIKVGNGPEVLIDLYSPTEQHRIVYTSPTMLSGSYLVTVRITGTKNPASSGYYGIHDYFTVYNPAPVTNTGYGDEALTTPSAGANNSAFGYQALYQIGTGSGNSAFGSQALRFVEQGNNNTAVGYVAMTSAVKSSGNTAVGGNAMPSAASTTGNTAVGSYALGKGVNVLGHLNNTAIGYNAMNISNPGFGNTALGANSGPIEGVALNGSTAIGNGVRTTASNQVRIGGDQVTSIGGPVSWSTLSDGRFKKDVKEDVSGLSFIKGLRPVSYNLDRASVKQFLGVEADKNEPAAAKVATERQTGFIAQEVDKLVSKSGYVFNGVDVPKSDKDFYSIRYSEFVVPLVKAVQELSAIVEEQKVALEAQQKKIDKLLLKIGEGDAGKAGETETLLLQNTPNPFNTNTEIKMVLPDNALSASIVIYNLEGKQLKEIRVTQRGNTSVSIPGSELNAGMYLYTLIVDGSVVDTKRMVLK